jgi:hypothetical protein
MAAAVGVAGCGEKRGGESGTGMGTGSGTGGQHAPTTTTK